MSGSKVLFDTVLKVREPLVCLVQIEAEGFAPFAAVAGVNAARKPV
jgi:hypothetical protein